MEVVAEAFMVDVVAGVIAAVMAAALLGVMVVGQLHLGAIHTVAVVLVYSICDSLKLLSKF